MSELADVDFQGQQQELWAALKKLIRSHPLDVGLFKEFVQNADDAGARLVDFVIDERVHPSKKIPDPALAVLNEPALAVFNDVVFSAQDLKNITQLGDSYKIERASKTGRFGSGFNVCYNVTDYPVLLTGDVLCLFDPLQTGSSLTKARNGYKFNLENEEEAISDLLRPFECGYVLERNFNFPGTGFRLPFRGVEQLRRNKGKLKNETVSADLIRSLAQSFRNLAPHILVFLKNVERIRIRGFSKSGQEFLILDARTVNLPEVRKVRERLLAHVRSENLEESLTRIEATTSDEGLEAYEHTVEIVAPDSKKTYRWRVVNGFVAEADLLKLARNLNQHGEKALPWVGAAALIDEEGVPLPQDGVLSCFLPLPSMVLPDLQCPVHIHGFVDLNEARDALTSTSSGLVGTTERLRGEWNEVLLRKGVGEAYARLVVELINESNAAPQIYQIMPPIHDKAVSLVTALVEGVYEALSYWTVIHAADGNWYSNKEVVVAGDSIAPALAAECWERICSPKPPDHVVAGLQLGELSPQELREWLRTDHDVVVAIQEAPRECLRKKQWVRSLLQECLRDEPGEDLIGLPLLILGDGKLHTIGYLPGDVLIASRKDQKLLWDPCRFVDVEFAKEVGLEEIPEVGILAFRAESLMVAIAELLYRDVPVGDPVAWDANDDQCPNEKWLIQVLRFLMEDESLSRVDQDVLHSCPLIPAQDGHLYCPGFADTPLVVSGRGGSRPINEALGRLSVKMVSGSVRLIESIIDFASVLRGIGKECIWELTPSDAVDSLFALVDSWPPDLISFEDEVQGEVLRYLVEDPSLLENEDLLEKLAAIPLFPTSIGTAQAPAACDLAYMADWKLDLPEIDFGVTFFLPGPWSGLLKALGIKELNRREVMENVIPPCFEVLDSDRQREVLLWLRLEFDRALEEAGSEREQFLKKLREVPLIRATNGELVCAGRLYDPKVILVDQVLGETASRPDLVYYGGAPEDWLVFFEQLGMARSPRAQDLADYVEMLVEKAEKDGTARYVSPKLEKVFDHLVRNWDSLDACEIENGFGDLVNFSEFLRDLAWLPVISDANELDAFVVWAKPEDRLYFPCDAYPYSRGYVCAASEAILPPVSTQMKASMREALEIPWIPPLEAVVNHFRIARQALLTRMASPNGEKGAKAVLRACYAFFGEEFRRLRSACEANPAACSLLETWLAMVRTTIGAEECVFIPELHRFLKPHHTYRNKKFACLPLTGALRFTDEIVELGLEALGRLDEPTAESLLSVIADLRDRCGGTVAPGDWEAMIRILHQLAAICQDMKDGSIEGAVYLPSASGSLRYPNELLDLDVPWMKGKLAIANDDVLHKDVPRVLSLMLKVSRLSKASQTVVSDLVNSSNKRFVDKCRRVGRRIRSEEFLIGLCRLRNHESGLADPEEFSWLRSLKFRPVVRLRCRYSIPHDDGDWVIGEAESDFYLDGELAEGGTWFIAEEIDDVFYERLAGELAAQFDPPFNSRLELTGMLDSRLGGIQQFLTKLKITEWKAVDWENGWDLASDNDETGDGFFDGLEMNLGDVHGVLATEDVRQQVKDEGIDKGYEDPENETNGGQEVDNDFVADGKVGDGIESNARRGNRLGGRRARMEAADHPKTERSSNIQKRSPAQRDLWISRPIAEGQSAIEQRNQDTGDDEAPRNHSTGRLAVALVMQYEREQGRRPQNMAHANPGYDIESRKGRGVVERFIEVKGIDGTWGPNGVPVSAIQFEKAQHLGDQFWLYVVENAWDRQNAVIHMIQNPVAKITQFRFDHGWRQAGVKVTGIELLEPKVGMWLYQDDAGGEPRRGEITKVSHSRQGREGTIYMDVRFEGGGPSTTVVFDSTRMQLKWTH